MGTPAILILGGGFGGITAARELGRELGDRARITLIERRPAFLMGLRKLWMVTGAGTRADGERALRTLRANGVEIRQAQVEGVDPQARTVRTDGGTLPFDYLIIALGADLRPDLVPGFSSAVYNLYDAFDAERLGRDLSDRRAGRVLVAVLGAPYKCPPAPYEAAMLLDDLFRRRGVREAIELNTVTPQPMSLPVAGPAACAHVEGLLAAKGIGFQANRKPVALEDRTLIFADGGRVAADVLIVVPPHRPPAAVRDSGLPLRGEWLAVDPVTLRAPVEGIFAVGDVVEIPLANGMPLPKAGLFAESQAVVVAAQIAAEIRRASPPAGFDGVGYCFIETGGGLATKVQGNFLAAPAPAVTIAPPSAEAYQQKVEFERHRLQAWFGA